jgi:hypothetical protein
MKILAKKSIIVTTLSLLFIIFIVGCATFRPVVFHEGERQDYYSRYVSDTSDSVQRLILYNESMTFELVALSKGMLDVQANLLYFYGRYEFTEAGDIIFHIYARDPRHLQLLQSSEQEQYNQNGPVTQRYQIITFNSKIIRLQTTLSQPLLHRYFGPIEDGKPPTIFKEV